MTGLPPYPTPPHHIAADYSQLSVSWWNSPVHSIHHGYLFTRWVLCSPASGVRFTSFHGLQNPMWPGPVYFPRFILKIFSFHSSASSSCPCSLRRLSCGVALCAHSAQSAAWLLSLHLSVSAQGTLLTETSLVLHVKSCLPIIHNAIFLCTQLFIIWKYFTACFWINCCRFHYAINQTSHSPAWKRSFGKNYGVGQKVRLGCSISCHDKPECPLWPTQ